MARGSDARSSVAARRRARLPGDRAQVTAEIVGLQAASDAVIYRHVFDNADREVGGVLVGRTAADGGFPLVTGAIPALSADEQRATLTFTQEAWAHVHRILESEFPPDEQIVGWYHSHPGFGVFLSGHDLFIHENFFSSPSQIAVVIDPHAHREGVFAWQGTELAALSERATPHGWIADLSAGDPSALRGPKPLRAPHDRRDSQARHDSQALRGLQARREPVDDSRLEGYPLLALAIAAVLGVLIGFGIWSLAESGSSAQAPRAGGAAHVRTHRVERAAAPESHIEVLGEGGR